MTGPRIESGEVARGKPVTAEALAAPATAAEVKTFEAKDNPDLFDASSEVKPEHEALFNQVSTTLAAVEGFPQVKAGRAYLMNEGVLHIPLDEAVARTKLSPNIAAAELLIGELATQRARLTLGRQSQSRSDRDNPILELTLELVETAAATRAATTLNPELKGQVASYQQERARTLASSLAAQGAPVELGHLIRALIGPRTLKGLDPEVEALLKKVQSSFDTLTAPLSRASLQAHLSSPSDAAAAAKERTSAAKGELWGAVTELLLRSLQVKEEPQPLLRSSSVGSSASGQEVSWNEAAEPAVAATPQQVADRILSLFDSDVLVSRKNLTLDPRPSQVLEEIQGLVWRHHVEAKDVNDAVVERVLKGLNQRAQSADPFGALPTHERSTSLSAVTDVVFPTPTSLPRVSAELQGANAPPRTRAPLAQLRQRSAWKRQHPQRSG